MVKFFLKNLYARICLDKYKTQETSDKAVDSFLSALKFFPGWFVTKPVINKLDHDLVANNDTNFVNEDSNYVKLSRNEIGILSGDWYSY